MGIMEKVLNCMKHHRLFAGNLQRTTVLWILTGALMVPAVIQAQISPAAYRALGQADLGRNGVNRVQGTEVTSPVGIALDSRGGQVKLFISDTGNHRVLGWADTQSYQAGDPPQVVLGQLSAEASAPLGLGSAGFNFPTGLALDPQTGDLYVADTGNHRVLRFIDPFNNPARVEPDAVYGQTDLNGRSPNGSGNVRNALRTPQAVAVDASGNLWIADTGNHRVLRYPAGVLSISAPAADLVLGQRDFEGNAQNRSGEGVTPAGFDSPAGLALDAAGNLYISDTGNARLLRFARPFAPESTAAAVIPVPVAATAGPVGLTVAGGQLYVAVPRENRVLVFPASGGTSSTPVNVYGQPDLNGREPNTGVHPRAAAFTLSEASDVKVDPAGNVFIADTGNHRVLRYPAGARSAGTVWGQPDFTANTANQVKPTGLNAPSKIAIDYSREPFALYVSDTRNHRILIWKDASRFQSGDPADGVIGQADVRSAFPNFDGTGRRATERSLSRPGGIAVDSQGALYVADTGNNRVLRFPRPADQPGVPAADLVLGQADFSASVASITGRSSLRMPAAVAIAPDNSVFVADTGNNRVVEYAPGAGNNAAAIRVYGQPNFASAIGSSVISAQTLTQPSGIAVDQGFNLYVADSGAHRIVIYANTRDLAPSSNAAAMVIGRDRFDGVASPGSGSNAFNGPSDVALDSWGRIYVADSRNHRVVVFPSLIFLPITNGQAIAVAGQTDLAGNMANWNSNGGAATAESLAAPNGIFVDRRDTLYVADSGNNRVLHFLKASRIYHGAFPQASALGRGALVTIDGEALAETEASSTAPLPQLMAEREVTVNDALRAPLMSVSPSSLNLQLPTASAAGASRIAVRVAQTGELIAGGIIPVATYAPGLYTRVLNQDGLTNSEAAPALKGGSIRLLGTGQGPVSPAIGDGEAAPEGSVTTVAVPTTDGNTCLTRQPSVCVAVGNTFGEVTFSGLAAGMVGVWQLDVRIPENAPSGAAVPVRAVINAVPSNIVTVAIR
jgi:uncharacterized protein (TIGR03437 family)